MTGADNPFNGFFNPFDWDGGVVDHVGFAAALDGCDFDSFFEAGFAECLV